MRRARKSWKNRLCPTLPRLPGAGHSREEWDRRAGRIGRRFPGISQAAPGWQPDPGKGNRGRIVSRPQNSPRASTAPSSWTGRREVTTPISSRAGSPGQPVMGAPYALAPNQQASQVTTPSDANSGSRASAEMNHRFVATTPTTSKRINPAIAPASAPTPDRPPSQTWGISSRLAWK